MYRLNALKDEKEDDEKSDKVCDTIAAYGLDCTADENDILEPCNCSKRIKISSNKWSKYLVTSDESNDDDDDDSISHDAASQQINHISSQDNNMKSREKCLEHERKQSHSLPTTQKPSESQSAESMDNLYEKKTFRSFTYPIMENSVKKGSSKWFVDYPTFSFVDQDTGEENVASSNKSTSIIPLNKHNIFKD